MDVRASNLHAMQSCEVNVRIGSMLPVCFCFFCLVVPPCSSPDAETNNLIILYPQAIASILQSNPNGCWDWWGYTGSFGSSTYATHGAPQMEIVRAVIKALGYKGPE
jgi:hypothetical protein